MIETVKYQLNNESIDSASKRLVDFLLERHVEEKDITRNRLFLEEILIGWKERAVSDQFDLSYGTRFGKVYVCVEAKGIPCNVLDNNEDDHGILVKNLMHSIENIPSYSYNDGENCIQLHFAAKKRNKLKEILVSIVLAVIVGLLIVNLLQQPVADAILNSLINPLYSALFRVLGFISGPLIMLSVVWGIYGIGDATTLNLVGKRMILKYLLIIFIIAFCGTLSFPFFSFTYDAVGKGTSVFKTLFEMVLGVIPSNIIQPFSEGNTLQIIFVAVIFGIAMLFLGKKVTAVAQLIEQINYIVEFLMEFISKMMPFFVFFIIIRIILNGTLKIFTSVWILFVMFVIAAIVLCTIFTLKVSISQKCSPRIIVKKSLPTLLIAITTASSAAAFSSNMETCEKRFGINKSICAFGIPLGMVMFKTSTTLYYVLISMFFAKQYGVAVSLDWILSVGIVSAMLAIATPPIPGGGIAAYTMLFSRLSIPDEALAIVLSMDIIFDFIRTSANMYNLPLALIGSASSFGKLDTEILRKE